MHDLFRDRLTEKWLRFMRRSINPKSFLSAEEKQRVERAVCEEEKRTSAEIKVVVLGHCWIDIRDKALHVFKKYGLHKTKDRNCVMLLLVVANREFVVFGDQGIHKHVRQEGWNAVRDEMARHFSEDHFGSGLCAGIRLIGETLARHFPRQPDDRNELSNEVVLENG